MKISLFYSLNLGLISFLSFFNKILNEECSTSISLAGLREEEQKQKCYSLSKIDESNDIRCCIHKKADNNGNECIKKSDTSNKDSTLYCPKVPLVPNNCGIAGVYQPDEAYLCKEISLVVGYCCYVKLKKKSDDSDSSSTSYLRARHLNKVKAEATNQIINYVGNEYTIESVDCHGIRIKYYWFLIIAIIFLL